jgi:hypothetical protein
MVMFEKPAYFFITLSLLELIIPNKGYADNKFIPKLSLQHEYVDYATTALDESGFVTRLTPGFDYQLNGRVFNLSADYQVDLLEYSGLEQNSQQNQSLNLNSDMTHIPGHWQSSANASIQQVNVSNNGTLITNPNLGSENKQELRTLSIGTILRDRTGYLDYSAGINLNLADYENEPQTQGSDLNLEISNRRTGDTITWLASLNSTVDESDDQSSQIDEIQLNLFYRFNSALEGYIQSSSTKTDSNQELGVDDQDISSYLLGVNWKASKSLFLSAGFGERDNEPNYSMDARLQGKHTTLSMKYSETVTTNRSVLLQQSENTAVQSDLVQTTSIVPVLYKRLDINLEVQGLRSRAGLNIYQTKQGNDLNDTDDEDVLSGSLYFSRKASARSTWNINLLMQETENSRSNTLKDLSLGYEYQLSKYSSILINMHNSKQDSNDAQNQYTEQSLGITYSISGV